MKDLKTTLLSLPGKRGALRIGVPRQPDRRERGSTLVEFGFVVVVLLTMMMGLIDFGRALYAYHFVSDAARQAARFAVVRGSQCSGLSGGCPLNLDGSEVTTYVQGQMPSGLNLGTVTTGAGSSNPNDLAVTTTWTGTLGDGTTSCGTPINYPGCEVQVTVQYTYGFTLPFITKYGKMNLSSTSQMVISQ